MASLYEHLPRVDFSTSDLGLQIVRTRPQSDTVLILAAAVDGPSEQIVSVESVPVIENMFGPVKFTNDYSRPAGVSQEDPFNGNYLMKALREVLSGGASNVLLMRVGGTKATGTHTQTGNAASGTILMTSRYGGRIYNSVGVQFTSGAASGSVTVSQPAAKGGDFTLTWSGEASGLTVREIVDRINRDSRNTTLFLQMGTVTSTAAARLLHGSTTLTGGLDGTIKDDPDYRANLYAALADSSDGALQWLEDEGVETDIVYIAGLYLDDQVTADSGTKYTTSVAQAFSEYLARRTMDHPQIGVLGVRPISDASSRSKVNEHYDALVTQDAGARGAASQQWINAGYFLHTGFLFQDAALGLDIDAGGYLQVVAADVIISDRDLGLYVESAAGIYAGTLARLRPHKAASNEEVRGVFSVPYFFSRSQLNALTGGLGRDLTRAYEGAGAYVTLRNFRGLVFTRDVTAAFRNSDFRDLQPLRLANAVHRGVKDIVHPYLGGPNDIAVRLGLETQIKNFLDGMADARAILGGEGTGYLLDVRGGDTDPLSNLLGILNIDITLVPALQIKEIKVRVRMALQA